MIWIRERRATSESRSGLSVPSPTDDRLRRWVERLAIPRHRFANARNNALVREQLARAFDERGLSVRIQGRFRNVVALPRTAPARPLTIIAAHYDSVPNCPGADDNASGLAVMLECARALATLGMAADQCVGFIAFNAEEDGLLGSRDFVENGLATVGLEIGSVHVLEMVGFRGGSSVRRLPLPWTPASLEIPDFIGVVGKGRSNAFVDRAMQVAAGPGLRVVAAKTWGPLHRLVPDLTRSDHFPFWDAGMPAVLWTDTGNFRNPNYHCFTDTPDTLDYRFMSNVTELLCATICANLRS